jgi:hypothetical protein
MTQTGKRRCQAESQEGRWRLTVAGLVNPAQGGYIETVRMAKRPRRPG